MTEPETNARIRRRIARYSSAVAFLIGLGWLALHVPLHRKIPQRTAQAMKETRDIAFALEAYRQDFGSYPPDTIAGGKCSPELQMSEAIVHYLGTVQVVEGREYGPYWSFRPPRLVDSDGDGSPPVAQREPALPADAVHREPDGGPVARVAMAQGKVDYVRGGAAEWTPATVGLELRASDRLRTGAGKARVEFVSGTRLHLNDSTRLTFRRERASELAGLDVRHGDVYVEADPSDTGLAVWTPHGRFVDLGTRFAVEVRPGASTVLVAEGTVRALTDAADVTVETGHQVVLVGRDAPPGEPVPVTDVESRLAWALGDIAPAAPALAAKPDLPPVALSPSRPSPVLSGWAAGWSYEAAGEYPRVFDYRERKAVWHTHPIDRVTPFKWKRTFTLENGALHTLTMDVTTHPFDGQVASDWALVVVVNGEEILREVVAGQHWRTFVVDLGRFAGRTIDLELRNAPGGGDPWRNEHGYWDNVRVRTQPMELGPR
jgi:ferric-dicitrate binding protein FerR (iron transport regulator)